MIEPSAPSEPTERECQYAVFDTPLGPCAVAWRAAGLASVELPEATADATVARMRRLVGEAHLAAPPPWVRACMDKIARHLGGDAQSFRDVPLDLARVPPFHRRVYEEMRSLEPGQTVSYAELARLAGSPNGSRAVGQAMARNPFPIVVPCHRVLAAGRKPGGFSAPGGVVTKARLLALEGCANPFS